MNAALAVHEIDHFRAIVTRWLGLLFDETKVGFLADVLRRRLEETRQSSSAYLTWLETSGNADELTLLAQELTVAETYFFRHREQYQAFAEVALPDCLLAMPPGGGVRIVSAGCASGEEPYSLAMIVRNTVSDPLTSVSIVGVDINPLLLDKAKRGRFSPWVLRETDPDVQRQWFRHDGREFLLDEGVRSSVKFEVCNLADDRAELWQPETIDIVFCRNVLMYFAQDVAQAVVNRLTRALRPGGYLFLGHAETLRGLSTDFHLRHTHGTFYYQRRDRPDRGARAAAVPFSVAGSRPVPLADLVERSDTWVETIGRSTQRIEALASAPGHSGSVRERLADSVKRSWEVGLALELLRQERFGDALELVDRFPPESARDPEVLLLRAVLLTHSGQLANAERACERLLAIDELNAGAHYVLALCREGVGDSAGAISHDQVAVYLDPSFAMAHLHLGLLARRVNDRVTAARELEQAIVLLQREEASRLLLFGGGFSRDALMALCRAELGR
jgi:chemotaxis protein methyltransferase CheR